MKPILLKTEMVRAILDGRKTVARQVVKPQPKGQLVPTLSGGCWPGYFEEIGTSRVQRPPYRPGNILYVRETWQQGLGGTYLYKASAGLDLFMNKEGNLVSNIPWCPSIHMPREAARIFLRVTDVRVERLQDCGDMEAKEEGCTCCSHFIRVWDSTIKPAERGLYGWEVNPWVWVIAFDRISKEEAMRNDL